MDVTAKLRYLRIAPRKVRLVADAVRGKSVAEADTILRAIPKHSSLPLRKLLASAVANAEHNFQLAKDHLFIKTLMVDEGPKLKRFRPRAFGRAAEILKRSSHITLILGGADKEAKKSRVKKQPKNDLTETKKRTKDKGVKLPPPADTPKPNLNIKETKAEAHDAPVTRLGVE